jgi:hypothetical protein
MVLEPVAAVTVAPVQVVDAAGCGATVIPLASVTVNPSALAADVLARLSTVSVSEDTPPAVIDVGAKAAVRAGGDTAGVVGDDVTIVGDDVTIVGEEVVVEEEVVDVVTGSAALATAPTIENVAPTATAATPRASRRLQSVVIAHNAIGAHARGDRSGHSRLTDCLPLAARVCGPAYP